MRGREHHPLLPNPGVHLPPRVPTDPVPSLALSHASNMTAPYIPSLPLVPVYSSTGAPIPVDQAGTTTYLTTTAAPNVLTHPVQLACPTPQVAQTALPQPIFSPAYTHASSGSAPLHYSLRTVAAPASATTIVCPEGSVLRPTGTLLDGRVVLTPVMGDYAVPVVNSSGQFCLSSGEVATAPEPATEFYAQLVPSTTGAAVARPPTFVESLQYLGAPAAAGPQVVGAQSLLHVPPPPFPSGAAARPIILTLPLETPIEVYDVTIKTTLRFPLHTFQRTTGLQHLCHDVERAGYGTSPSAVAAIQDQYRSGQSHRSGGYLICVHHISSSGCPSGEYCRDFHVTPQLVLQERSRVQTWMDDRDRKFSETKFAATHKVFYPDLKEVVNVPGAALVFTRGLYLGPGDRQKRQGTSSTVDNESIDDATPSSLRNPQTSQQQVLRRGAPMGSSAQQAPTACGLYAEHSTKCKWGKWCNQAHVDSKWIESHRMEFNQRCSQLERDFEGRDAGAVFTVHDPEKRSVLQVPKSAIAEFTRGLLQGNAVEKHPSVCILHQKKRCTAGSRCNQVHVHPFWMSELRKRGTAAASSGTVVGASTEGDEPTRVTTASDLPEQLQQCTMAPPVPSNSDTSTLHSTPLYPVPILDAPPGSPTQNVVDVVQATIASTPAIPIPAAGSSQSQQHGVHVAPETPLNDKGDDGAQLPAEGSCGSVTECTGGHIPMPEAPSDHPGDPVQAASTVPQSVMTWLPMTPVHLKAPQDSLKHDTHQESLDNLSDNIVHGGVALLSFQSLSQKGGSSTYELGGTGAISRSPLLTPTAATEQEGALPQLDAPHTSSRAPQTTQSSPSVLRKSSQWSETTLLPGHTVCFVDSEQSQPHEALPPLAICVPCATDEPLCTSEEPGSGGPSEKEPTLDQW